MAFLDNSGDIILDAVLTDAGRQRMARGNFKIVKFALGDEEVNYELFNSNHPSGSAFYDLEVMQTPILEAFTNNTASMKSRLMTIARTNILHLPILKLNEIKGGAETRSNLVPSADSAGMFVIVADRTTEEALVAESTGVMFGFNLNEAGGNKVIVDQGQDTAGDPPITQAMDSDLIETQYIVQVDNRLGRIVSESGAAQAVSFVDDDDIATYYFGLNSGAVVTAVNFRDNGNQALTIQRDSGVNAIPFTGPTGTRLTFKLASSPQLRSSSALLTKLGGSSTVTVVKGNEQGNDTVCYYADTNIRVTGVTTGYSIDIPVRFVRKV
jgi:hypothetical protein